jgi:SNF2 family DNA or RNA helicase
VKPFDHQIKTLDFATEMEKYIDGSDMGTGKTLSTLLYIDRLMRDNPSLKVLVVAPKSIILSGWVGDVHKYFPHIMIQPCIGTKAQKLAGFSKVSTIYVTNYESFHGRFEFTPGEFDMLVCDEAVKLKNSKAKWTKEITRLSRSMRYIVLLSGLLTPNNLQEIYAPFNIIAPNLLGKSFWGFRSHFFTPNVFSFQQKEWVPKQGADRAIMDLVKPYIIRHTKEECLDLPEQIFTVREVQMTDKQAAYYRQMHKEMVLTLKDGNVPATTKATVLNKLSQISSGFIYDTEKKTHHFESSKLNELDDIIMGELQNEKVLIFYTFKGEVDVFKVAYPEASFITGGQNAEDQAREIEGFQSGSVRLIFASVSAAKYGITLTACSNVIYFSLNYSLDDMEQSKARVHRIGQSRVTNYIYLLSKNTVDMRIYNAILKKQSLNEIVNGMIEEGE